MNVLQNFIYLKKPSALNRSNISDREDFVFSNLIETKKKKGKKTLVDLKGMILLINCCVYVFNVGLKRRSIFIPQVDMHKKNGLTVYSRTESYVT